MLINFADLKAQCTTTNMTTAVGASVSGSGTGGLCAFCSVSNTANVTNTNTTDFATVSIPVGVGGFGFISVKLPQTYPAGTRVGWVADVNGGIAGLFNGVTLIAKLNGTVVATQSGGSLINVLGIGGGTNINAVFCSAFDEVEIRLGSLAGLLASYRVFYAYVNDGCSFPVQCALATASPEICGDGIDNDGDGLIDNEDSCLACNAGGIAPVLSATTKSNTCPTSTVDLTTITASNTPANTVLEWHSATPATAANKVAVPSAVVAGTYYAVFYDAVNNCYSNNFGTVGATAVTATVISCTDNDGDGITNDNDIDDDNDGVPDVTEGRCVTPSPTTTWTVSGTQASGSAGSVGVTFNSVASIGTNTNITYVPNGAFNTTNFWFNPSLAGATSLEYTHTWDTAPETSTTPASGDAGTRQLTITFASPITRLLLNIDRLGGSGQAGTGNFFSNSAEFTLTTSGMAMNKLSGNTQLIVTTDKFFREPNIDLGATNPGANANNTTGTAAGTVELKKADGSTFTSLTFNITGVGVEGAGSDGIEMILEACQDLDTDSDGIANYLDLDSDNDGCSDAFEASATTNTTSNFVFSGAVGTNGLVNSLETVADNGVINYTSTYSTRAINSSIAVCCNAGTTAPALSSTTISNACPASTINLTTITVSNTPAGAVLEWHSALPATAANKVNNLTTAPAGTYYAVFYDAVGNCYSDKNGASGATTVIATVNGCPAIGTIDCSKTQIYTAPVFGQPSQNTLVVSVNITSTGCLSPITISGSGMTLANGITQVCTGTVGIQNFSIPVNYDGSTLSTVNFTIGGAGSCSANLAQPPKKAISEVWTLDCVPTVAPSLK
ncbi:MAG: hypothetical protein ACOVO2_16140 [Emticicia sp.]